MSLGALGPEAHETLDDRHEPHRRQVRQRRGRRGSGALQAARQRRQRQLARSSRSPRAGSASPRNISTNCREIEIKIAQGAKPGEGGQLPGFKVTEMIARLRHATPGVIADLAAAASRHLLDRGSGAAHLRSEADQPARRAVCVKLVARSGIGTIAAGVAKAKADVILISGHSRRHRRHRRRPRSSMPACRGRWGSPRRNQVLTLNRLRHRVRLRTDGGIKTGRDVVIAAMLGAEEFGIGTAVAGRHGLHHGAAVPFATPARSASARRTRSCAQKFTGTPEKVVNLFSFIAEEVREILASLGFRSRCNEVIGRTDLLAPGQPRRRSISTISTSTRSWRRPIPATIRAIARSTGRNEVPDTLDAQMIKDAQALFERRREDAAHLQRPQHASRHRHAAVVARSCGRFGMSGLQPRPHHRAAARLGRPVARRLRRAGPQARGVRRRQRLCRQGPVRRHHRRAPDGVEPADRAARTRSSATPCSTAPPRASCSPPARPASASPCAIPAPASVVEGCGSNGCEYMTGGMAVILGAGRRQFRRRHDRRHGLRLRRQDEFPAARQCRDAWSGSASPRPIGKACCKDAGRRACRARRNRASPQQLLARLGRGRSAHFWQVVPKEMLAPPAPAPQPRAPTRRGRATARCSREGTARLNCRVMRLLYHLWLSPSSRKIRIVLQEKGLDFT